MRARQYLAVLGFVMMCGLTLLRRDVSLILPENFGDFPKSHEQSAETYESTTITIHGVSVVVVTRQSSILKHIKNHIQRELHAYAILKDAILAYKASKTGNRPLIVDIGANHGLFTLFAAKLGADVIAVEPQTAMCNNINAALKLNEIGRDRVKLYNNAVFDSRQSRIGLVTRADRDSDGGDASIVLTSPRTLKFSPVSAFPVASFLNNSSRDVDFMKIDVEGFEIRALASTLSLLQEHRIRHLLVEFGPPARWERAKQNTWDAMAVVERILLLQYQLRLVASQCWNRFLIDITSTDEVEAAHRDNFVSLDHETDRVRLLTAMQAGEAYLWFLRKEEVSNRMLTWSHSCAHSHSAVRPNQTTFGCW